MLVQLRVPLTRGRSDNYVVWRLRPGVMWQGIPAARGCAAGPSRSAWRRGSGGKLFGGSVVTGCRATIRLYFFFVLAVF